MKLKLKVDETQFSCLRDASGSAILLTDANGRIQYINAELLFRADNLCSLVQDKHVNWQRYNDEQQLKSAIVCENKLFNELKQAVKNKELYLAAQPIFDFDSGEVMIVEILLRWTHISYGEISPLKIIELAGNNDYLFDIATYVTEKLIEFLQTNSQRHENVCFAINLNLPQIINPKLIRHLLNLIDSSGIKRSKFIFESTETDALPVSVSEAAAHFHQIRCQGIKIAMDDFGSGYSTLDYINNLDVDLIKIDRSLVTGIENSPRKLDTLLSLIQLCKRIGVTTIIEGIENEQQHHLIVNSGIRGILVQGFLYARPSPLSLNQFCSSRFIEQPDAFHLQRTAQGVG